MTNHVHFIVSKNGSEELPSIIRDFKKFTSIKLIEAIQSTNESRREWMLKIFEEEADKIKRVKSFKVWQDGNHPVQLDTNQMLDERLEYIHQNPVKSGWVEKPQDYRWSSAIDYCSEKGILPIALIK
jgi:REP element-mobilizing transposase RayT